MPALEQTSARPQPAAPDAPFIEVRGLAKHFGGVQALAGVDIDIRAGEVHGLVGANGAGKSTLIKLLAGLQQPDAGTIVIDGKPTVVETPERATSLGLSFIHQELHLVPQLNVLENIMLGAPKPTRFGMVDWRRLAAEVKPIAAKVGIAFPLDREIARLSTAEKWLISICRALVRKCRLMVMDEPTASLSAAEAERLFQIVRDLAASGIAVLYVSHRLDEILDLCDRVTAFRDGRRVLQLERGDLTRRALVESIVGGAAPEALTASDTVLKRDVIFRVQGLRRLPMVKNVGFDLHRGEVLGLAGLVGAGRSETVRMIFGADRPHGGTMTLDGAAFAPRSPVEAMQAGIGLVPEERRSEGLILEKSVAFNIGLTNLKALELSPLLPLLKMGRRTSQAESLVKRLLVKTPSTAIPVGRLSGGNQQKVALAKWLARELKILILDEPSRGVDVGARAEIHRIIRDLAEHGLSTIVISSDAEELPGLCDRVLVMSEGVVAAELKGTGATREAILHASYAHSETRKSA
ncbi:MAG TPA: sugar ABC transporter ATP-binding protein [Dongiaceae bacterium]|nr:sugar ABC transporter ATP-binding protein [Dongiaceae bacterium]